MSSSTIPVTDAFDETDPMESLEVALTPQQITWLKDTAAERGLSVDHMLRALLNAQMRAEENASTAPAASGDGQRLDGVPSVSDGNASPTGDDVSRLNEHVRSTSERVPASADAHGDASSQPSDDGTSMFDMMNE